jgi:hypothetical protein
VPSRAEAGDPADVSAPVRFAERVIATAIVGNDQTYLKRPCVHRRAIQVDTSAVGITEFDAPKEQRDALVAKGDRAAQRFLNGWDWERYKKDCRRSDHNATTTTEPPSRPRGARVSLCSNSPGGRSTSPPS